MQIDTALTPGVIGQVQPAAAAPSRRLAMFGLASLFAVFLISILFRPSPVEYFSVCGFKNITGLPCPGCGLTHSFCALGKGEVGAAFTFNLLGPPLFLFLVLLWIRCACVLLNRGSVVHLMDRLAGRLNLAWAFAIAFAVYGVVRIAYLIVYDPAPFHESPLSQLLAHLIH